MAFSVSNSARRSSIVTALRYTTQQLSLNCHRTGSDRYPRRLGTCPIYRRHSRYRAQSSTLEPALPIPSLLVRTLARGDETTYALSERHADLNDMTVHRLGLRPFRGCRGLPRVSCNLCILGGACARTGNTTSRVAPSRFSVGILPLPATSTSVRLGYKLPITTCVSERTTSTGTASRKPIARPFFPVWWGLLAAKAYTQ